MIKSHTCPFSVSILHTSSYYIITFLTHFCQAAGSIKIRNLLICFCILDFSCLILEKDNFIENLFLVAVCVPPHQKRITHFCVSMETSYSTEKQELIYLFYSTRPLGKERKCFI